MPVRVNPIPRPGPQRFRESSALRSPRDSDDLTRAHIKEDRVAKQVAVLTENVRRLQEQFNRLRLRRGGEDTDTTTSPCPYA